MKSIKKFLFIMAALAAVLAFVSCSNGDDGGASSNNSNNNSNNSADNNSSNNNNNANSGNNVSKPSVVATYVSLNDDKELTFFSDGTWSVTGYDSGKEITWSKGTYLGKPEKNGDIEFTYTKYWDAKYSSEKDVDPTTSDYIEERKVKDGVLNFDYSFNYTYIDFKRQ